MSVAWIFPVLAAQRLFEVALSRRNRKIIEARGGRECHAGTFPLFILLHGGFLVALCAESYPWRVPADARTAACLAALVLLSAVRYWCVAALGPFWNARIVVLPGHPLIRAGPYRWLRHPNYLVVALEFLALPLLLRTPWTLSFFFPANLLLLGSRIRLEEKALDAAAPR